MKQAILGLGLVLALAACGGGGGGTPNPIPSTTPKTTYASKLIFVGALAGHTIQSDLRRIQSLSPMDASATPIPIMVVSPITSQGNIGANQASNWGGDIQAQVSPMPSSAPTVTFTQTNPDANLGTPIPQPTVGVVSEAPIAGLAATTNAQSSGVATATIGDPVNQSPTANVYAYQAISLECKTPLDPGSSPAYKWNGSGWDAVSDPTQADVYLTGSQCTVPGFNSSETYMTVHVPGGGVAFSTDTPFSGLTASQWSNVQTAFDLHVAITQNPDGSSNSIFLSKTADGTHIFKLFPLSFGYLDGYDGAIEVSGSGVDGF